MPLRLYMMSASPPCWAVLMTVKYIGLDVIVIEENVFVGDQSKSELAKINPRCCVPTIDDDGFILWESRAIMTYLANKYAPCDPIYPKDPVKRAAVDMMLNFDLGSLYKAQVDYFYPQVFGGEFPEPTKEKNYQKALNTLEFYLKKWPYVAGEDVSLADFSIVANVIFAEEAAYDFSRYPSVVKWLKRLRQKVLFLKDWYSKMWAGDMDFTIDRQLVPTIHEIDEEESIRL